MLEKPSGWHWHSMHCLVWPRTSFAATAEGAYCSSTSLQLRHQTTSNMNQISDCCLVPQAIQNGKQI
eukprot:2102040-Amphidinium_carterae.1